MRVSRTVAKKKKPKAELKGRARLRSEIAEMTQGLHRLGMVSDGELQQTTLAMLGRDALPKIATLSHRRSSRCGSRLASASRCWPAS